MDDLEPATAEQGASVGESMYELARRLFPLNRSLTGDGVRETLRILRERLPALVIEEVPSGTKVFDWTVPDEWNVREAFLVGPDGRRVVDFAEHNLHLVGYSVPVDDVLTLDELQPHLFSRPELPDAIPYVTSYYTRRWGFCLAHNRRVALEPGNYHAFVDSTLAPGSLSYGELVVPGETEQEIFVSTYVCHPSMANNELSGIVVASRLAEWVLSAPRRFTYRFVFIPETIGAVVYVNQHLDHLRRMVVAGFQVTCVGDDRATSFLPSRRGGTLADRCANHVLRHYAPDAKRYSFLDRGSDERQYCSPGVDLPMVSIMRSKYGTYPEYHTSLDDLDFISEVGLARSFDLHVKCLETLESNWTYRTTMPCEPQLAKRGLYPTLGSNLGARDVKPMMHLLAYSDGDQDLLGTAELISLPAWELAAIAEVLLEHELIERID